MPYIQKILEATKKKYGNPVCVDIGANLGLFSYLMSCQSSRVIAIEPQPKLASYLKAVLPKNVVIENLAVSDHDGIAQMRIPKVKGLGGASAQQDALATIEESNPITKQVNLDFIEVPIKTLDQILKDESRVDFIKIDVEGHELSVLNGANRTLSEFRPTLMVELFKEHNPNAIECFKTIFNLGYTAFYCNSSGIIECGSIESAIVIINNPALADRVITNFFFVPMEKKELIFNLFHSS